MKFVDTHCHLNIIAEKLTNRNLDSIIHGALINGVNRLLTISTQPKEYAFIQNVCQQYKDFVFGALGLHPHEAQQYLPSLLDEVRELVQSDEHLVAIGEIGLDYYYEFSERSIQREAFIAFLSLSQELNLPVVIHSREAEEDTLAIIKDFPELTGVVHCFTGSLDFAKKIMNYCPQLYFGFTGVITFKNAENVKDVVRHLPLSKILIETDAPFMAPVPYRGKVCLPEYIPEIAQQVAVLKNETIENVVGQTNENAEIFFKQRVVTC